MTITLPGFYACYCPDCGLMSAFCTHDAPKEIIDSFHALAKQIGQKVYSFSEGEFDGLVWCQCGETA